MKRVSGWREVAGCLQSNWARSWVASEIRTAGFTLDEVGYSKPRRQLVVDCLVAVEDTLELASPRCDERAAVKAVRRVLEMEVCS